MLEHGPGWRIDVTLNPSTKRLQSPESRTLGGQTAFASADWELAETPI